MTFKSNQYRYRTDLPAALRNTRWENQLNKNGAVKTAPCHGVRGEYLLTQARKPLTGPLAVYRISIVKGANEIEIQFRGNRFMVDLDISPTIDEPL